MMVFTYVELVAIPLVMVVIGIGYGMTKAHLPRTARVQSGLRGCGLTSGMYGIIFLVASARTLTEGSSDSLAKWLVMGIVIIPASTLALGLPFLLGAALCPMRKSSDSIELENNGDPKSK